MLQQQINYWTLRETMRHNRVGEGIYQQDADTNRINANTNIYNAQINAINATSNRIQANAAVIQAGAAVRQAGAAERQAGVQERNVSVTEKLYNSKNWNNYVSPLGSALGNGTNIIGTPLRNAKPVKPTSRIPKGYMMGADGYWSVKPTTGRIMATGAKAGLIGLGAAGGVLALKTVYDYQKESDKAPIKRTW